MSVPLVITAALGVFLLGASSSHRPKPKPKAHQRMRHPRTHGKPLILQHSQGSRAEAYAALSPGACLTELGRRDVGFVREEPKRGVKIPVRLRGALGGVLYRTDYPDAERGRTPWEIFDCRLVLALDDFSHILRAHRITEVRIFSAWRPPPKSSPMDHFQRRHPGALAVDLREFRRDDGEVLNVLADFYGQLDAPVCGAAASVPSADHAHARELREIVCAAVDAHLFNSVLTPNYNQAHKNHFHVELTPDVDWFMLR